MLLKTMKSRLILHIDMDAFFASIEQFDNPDFRGKPVVVGADPKGGKGRGVVSTASYEARKFGIHSAMPISKAYRLCPDAVYVRPRMRRYVEVSKRIMEILSEFSPLIEQVSIDEAFLDCTGTERLFGNPVDIGKKIKGRIFKELGLKSSIGIASSKSVAKILSDLSKPDGLLYCEPGKEKELLSQLDIKYLWGAGEKTVQILRKHGFNKIGDIAESDGKELIRIFGVSGKKLWELANGIDDREVVNIRVRKSIGREITFQEDVDDLETLEKTILYLVDRIAYSMAEEGIMGKTVTLKIRFEDFTTFTRSKTLNRYTDFVEDIKNVAVEKLHEFNIDKKRKRVRLLGVSVSNLIFKGTDGEYLSGLQRELFVPEGDEKEKVQKVLHAMKKQFGDIVKRAIFINGEDHNDYN